MDSNYKRLAYAVIACAIEDLKEALIEWAQKKDSYNKQRVLDETRFFYSSQFVTYSDGLAIIGSDIVMPLYDNYGFTI